jgi:VCBS repeat-containing protein
VPTYTGNNGSNTINGSNGDDTINGLGGNDDLSGGNGDDTISGGEGDDDIDGGNGNDDIDGGNGDDDIDGGNGNDDIDGGSGEDVIDGGNGDDDIDGGDDDDIIYGGNGGDALNGGGGNDELFGQNGNDHLTGGAGDDLIDGNNGFDIAYYSGNIGEYSFFAAAGYLHVVHLGGAGPDGHDQLIRVERLVFADRVVNIGSGHNVPVAVDDHVFINEDTGTYSSGAASVKDNDFDFDGDPLTVTGGTFTGTYGTLTLNANGTYSYTLFASAQALDTGENVTDSFNYILTDNDGSDTGTLVFHIAGLNDAPVANDDTASTTEDTSVAGNVLTNDTDVDVEPLTVANPGTYIGTYGTLVLAADGSYTYTPGAAAQGLDDGEVVNDAFGYVASDGTASDTATLTVTVTGFNDAPVANDDTASTTEEAAVSGNVLTNDTDVDVEPLTVTNPGTYVGTYGTLVLAADGSYTYTPNAAAQGLDDGEVVNDAFGYTASDGTASDTATLTVTVTGLNDAPVANDDAVATTEDAAVAGNVLTNDTDVDVEPLTVTNPGTYVGTYGTLVLAADGSYTYTPNAVANALAAGEVAQDAFGYTASDGTASDTATLTVTVNGTNDAPTIDAGGTDDSGSVTELPNNDPNENAFTHTDSGTIAFDDVDLSDTHSASFTPQGGGYLGTFTLDPVNQGGDTVGWDFSVSDSDLDFLADGQTLTQTYTVEIDDGNGGTATQDVTITITGESDGPQTEWYIDNSAVGSTNVGTQADPFTSIAAFNAAQGTVGGPQIGATVYLLAGTGTYAEADGFNLLDDQILIGVPAGPVRPTIVTTGGGSDAIEVAQNNTITGLDIGNVNDVGIADSNGSVGTLTVSDVGKSGTGQIVDIDQGGTLNVTLNSAESLASNDGAIDLEGVGGSFTVTGATTITGIHSDGGIDITSSSLTATFAGGGLVSTNNAIAINFVGNTGALVLGGGLDIVTTTGQGLNATGGGTVTATGSGNSVTSAFGNAVTISGTGIGAAGVTFESVSAGGGVNGIVLANTGAAGGFTVTGDGGGANNGSGGTIQNASGDGVLLTNTESVHLGYMNIQTNADNGIGGSGVNGFVLDRVNISGNGDSAATDDAGIDIANLTGSASAGARPTAIINSVISNNHEFEVQITNTSGSLVNLQVIGSTISSNGATGAHGNLFNFLALGTASMGIKVSGSTFDGNTVPGALTGTGLNIDASGGSVQADVGTSSFIDNNVAVNLSTATTGSLTFDVHDNGQVTGSRSTGINVSSASGATGTIDGMIQDNVVGTFAVAGSGSLLGRGVQVTTSGGGTTNLLIDDNTVQSIASLEGISVVDNVTAGIVNATITDNIIRDIPLARGLNLQTATAGNTLNTSISGNQFINVAGPPGDPNATVLRLNEGAGTALNVTQLAATAAVNAAEVDDANGIPNTKVSVAGTPQYGQPAPTLPTGPSLPLLADSEGAGTAADDLSQGQLDLVVAAAIDRWAAAGATADQIAAMRESPVSVADLTGLHLGASAFGAIEIDRNAAGHGWFVDLTPGEDGEFDGGGSALDGGPADGSIDLLTVLMHEFGHRAGFVHDQGELMGAALGSGERRLPDQVFATEGAHDEATALVLLGFDIPPQHLEAAVV